MSQFDGLSALHPIHRFSHCMREVQLPFWNRNAIPIGNLVLDLGVNAHGMILVGKVGRYDTGLLS